MSDRLFIFDTTLRDGEQVPGCQLNTVEKIQVAKALELMGVDVIEAGFPVSSPGDFNSVIEISKAVTWPVICALTRAVEHDIDVAVEALKYAKHKRIHTGIGTSDEHIKYKFNSTREKILEQAVAATKYAKRFVDDVEFYCEDAGRTDNAFLAQVVEAVIKAGATVVNIPDTTGYCLPEEYYEKIKYLKDHVDDIDRAIISTHCHNDLGMATANTLNGVLAGARQVEVTINGIGERAGNTSLEEIAMILKCHKGLGIETNINTTKIYPTSRMVSSLMNMPVQPNKAIVGRNAFAHSSGIHQDGVLKNVHTYEIMDPKDVGIDDSTIMLTARSGRAALKHRLMANGVELSEEKLDKVYEKFLQLADQKKEVSDADVLMLAGADTAETHAVRLDFLQVTTGKGVKSVASIGLDISGQKFEAAASGNGPVDAAIKALKKIIMKQMTLKEFTIQAISKGSDDVGKVHMQVEYDGSMYYGFGADTDIVTVYMLFDQGAELYALYPHDGAYQVTNHADISAHEGFFGIEQREWQKTPDYQERLAAHDAETARLEQFFLTKMKEPAILIYQLRDSEDLRDYYFASFAELEQHHLTVDRQHYEPIYAMTIPGTEDKTENMLNDAFYHFNIHRPDDFRGHSVSVSDIIAVKVNGEVSCHYVDAFGFKKLDGFIRDNPLKNAEMAVEDDYGLIDGIINNGKAPVLEEQKKEPLSILSRLSEPLPDRKPREPAVPKKNKEMER